MPLPVQSVLDNWTSPVLVNAALLFEAVFYLRGWFRLRSARLEVVPGWRAVSFLLGLFLIWLAIGSPLAAFDEQSLTIHMVQHLLLMTFAPALILLGAPVMPFLHGLPQRFVQRVLGPFFPGAQSGMTGNNRPFAGLPPLPLWSHGMFPLRSRWLCNRRDGTRSSTLAFSLPVFSFGGPSFSLGPASRYGRDGRFCFICF